MPKRSSRPITVDDVRYRWSVSHRIDPGCSANLGSGHQYLMVLVERDDAPGQLVKAAIRLAERNVVVGPGVVAELIRHAIENGCDWGADTSPESMYVGFDRMYDEFWPCDIGPGGTFERKRWPRNW